MSHSLLKKEIVHEKTSTLLKRASVELTEDNIQAGMLLYRLRRRSFGGLLFFLSILSFIPGIAIFSSIVMMTLGLQLLVGFRAPRLPRFMSEYRLNVDYLKIILNRTAPKIEKLEKYIKPRLLVFTLTPFTLILGLLIICLAALVLIPLPFTNFLPALAILSISLGLLERDGLLILMGSVLSTFSFILGGSIIYWSLQRLGNIL